MKRLAINTALALALTAGAAHAADNDETPEVEFGRPWLWHDLKK